MAMPTSAAIEIVEERTGYKARIKPALALAEVFPNSLPALDLTLDQYFHNIESHVRSVSRQIQAELAQSGRNILLPSSSAFNNCRGFWFESLASALAHNTTSTRHQHITFLFLPNILQFDFKLLLEEPSYSMLGDLERSLHASDVSLITSNPDLMILRDIPNSRPNNMIENLSIESLRHLQTKYQELEHGVPWDCICGGVGLKTSMRPDRRLQIVHEGNISKAFFAHLQHRHWRKDYSFKYFALCASNLSDADKEAFRTAVTHSIVDVNTTPERAVDAAFSVNNIRDLSEIFATIASKIV